MDCEAIFLYLAYLHFVCLSCCCKRYTFNVASHFISEYSKRYQLTCGFKCGFKMPLVASKLDKMLKGFEGKTPKKLADRDGLIALCRPSGKVSFVFRFRFDGKQQTLTLGEYTGKPQGMALSVARSKAAECKAWLNDGYNPSVRTKLIKSGNAKPVTVKDALEHWIDNHAKKNRVNWSKVQSQFNKWIYPKIGELPLADCGTSNWIAVFDKYKAVHPVGSGYAFQAAKQALKFCRVRKYAVSNALDDLSMADAGSVQKAKKRVLNFDELTELIQWIDSLSPHKYYANIAAILLATGARTQEVRLSKIDEWDLDKRLWTVPEEHNKNKKKLDSKGLNAEILRPIPTHLMPLIIELKQRAIDSNCEYILGELKQSPAVSSFAPTLAKKLGHDKWNWHDLRRTLATVLNESGVNPLTVESLLGHSLQGSMSHYVHADRLRDKSIALDTWRNLLANEEANNVIVMSAGNE